MGAPPPRPICPSPSTSPTPSSSPFHHETAKPGQTTGPATSCLSGPGTTEPGILLIATPASGRHVRRLGGRAVRRPDLRGDRSGHPTSPPWADSSCWLNAVARQVQVSAGDQPVLVPDGRVAPRDEPLQLPAERDETGRAPAIGCPASPSGRFRREPTGPSPASVRSSAVHPATFRSPSWVPGRSVRNLTCPHLRLSERACAAGSPSRLRVDRSLPLRDARIQVQLDLPRPQ